MITDTESWKYCMNIETILIPTPTNVDKTRKRLLEQLKSNEISFKYYNQRLVELENFERGIKR